jgi:hypothetical protein
MHGFILELWLVNQYDFGFILALEVNAEYK